MHWKLGSQFPYGSAGWKDAQRGFWGIDNILFPDLGIGCVEEFNL